MWETQGCYIGSMPHTLPTRRAGWARVCQCGASPYPPSCTQASQLAS